MTLTEGQLISRGRQFICKVLKRNLRKFTFTYVIGIRMTKTPLPHLYQSLPLIKFIWIFRTSCLLRPSTPPFIRNPGVCFKKNSNSLSDNYINIFDEPHKLSTLKDGFKQACNEAFIYNNSESITDFNVDSQLIMLTCKLDGNNNFDSIKQITSNK